jgi:tripartite-type tricarboxylate transporter receptor subunit TctC
MVVPYPPGGPVDGMARIICDRLGQVLGQSVVVDSKGGGAGGSVGAKFVAASEPDGYTILITPGGTLTSGPAVYKNIGYDPAKVFTPVALLIETPQIIYVSPSLPTTTLAELATYAKANPGKISWGSQGFGTGPHLLAEMFKLQAGVSIVHVPYRGTAPMQTALLANEIQVAAGAETGVLPHIEDGRVRPLAVAARRRAMKLTDVPTTGEAGYPKLLAPFWLGVVTPAGTPPAIVDKLNAALRASLEPPETRERLATLGAEIRIGTPAEFGRLIDEERAMWAELVKAANLQVD